MTRYAARRPYGCDCDEDPPFTQDITIFEADDEGWIDTGLLDRYGEPILRTEKGPLGFDLSPRCHARLTANDEHPPSAAGALSFKPHPS